MSYHGYLPLVKQYLHNLPQDYTPSVLEVGVDNGVSYITLATFLARTRKNFVIAGVDVLLKEHLKLTLSGLDVAEGQQMFLIENNSLTVLPNLIEEKMKFDVVLLDGDHNYYTVQKELEYLEALTHDHSLVIVDDYDGRWANRDLWYAERPEYENVKNVTPKIDSEKQGANVAIDEWLVTHPDWVLSKPIEGEPIVLSRRPPVQVQDVT